eukprot:667466-Amorphochlora_amoeboformis.AAC.1
MSAKDIRGTITPATQSKMASKATHDQLCYAFLGYLNELQEGKGNELEIGTEELEGFEVFTLTPCYRIVDKPCHSDELTSRIFFGRFSRSDCIHPGDRSVPYTGDWRGIRQGLAAGSQSAWVR